MAFVVEDGTGLANANSYVDTTYADSYFSDRGNTAWAALGTPAKQAALVQATDFVEKNFYFVGWKRSQAQALEWPRYDAFDKDGRIVTIVPDKLKKGVCEYALRAASATLQPDPTTDLVGLVASKFEQVGPIKEKTDYVKGASPNAVPSYPAADALFKEFVVRFRGFDRA